MISLHAQITHLANIRNELRIEALYFSGAAVRREHTNRTEIPDGLSIETRLAG